MPFGKRWARDYRLPSRHHRSVPIRRLVRALLIGTGAPVSKSHDLRKQLATVGARIGVSDASGICQRRARFCPNVTEEEYPSSSYCARR